MEINMKTSRLLMSVVGLALIVTPAFARHVPALSGKYASNYNQTCQALQSTANPGSTYQSIFVSNFDSASGTVQLDGTASSGALVVWTGGSEGMTDWIVHKNSVYSNDATTATFDGVVYSVVYGSMKNGIAQSAVFSGQPIADCAVSIVLIHQ